MSVDEGNGGLERERGREDCCVIVTSWLDLSGCGECRLSIIFKSHCAGIHDLLLRVADLRSVGVRATTPTLPDSSCNSAFLYLQLDWVSVMTRLPSLHRCFFKPFIRWWFSTNLVVWWICDSPVFLVWWILYRGKVTGFLNWCVFPPISECFCP